MAMMSGGFFRGYVISDKIPIDGVEQDTMHESIRLDLDTFKTFVDLWLNCGNCMCVCT